MEWVDELIKLVSESGSTVTVACGLAIGALATALVNHLKNKNDYTIQHRIQNRDQFEVILQERKQEVDENKKEIRELHQQLIILQEKVNSLESILTRRPFPEWSLSFGKYTWCNAVFEYIFLAPMGKNASWLIGKTPEEVWTLDVAKTLAHLDSYAKTSDWHVAFTHNVKILDNDYTVIKYGNMDSISGRIINYFGMAIPQAALLT